MSHADNGILKERFQSDVLSESDMQYRIIKISCLSNPEIRSGRNPTQLIHLRSRLTLNATNIYYTIYPHLLYCFLKK